MARHLMILLLQLCLSLISSDGRTLQKNVHEVIASSSKASFLGTNPKDVNGLAAIVSQFPLLLLGEDTDDPCFPNQWTWIVCTTDASPRVTALYLGNRNMVGLFPYFSTMDALQTIDMHQNFLTGTIPDFLGTLPNLTELDLSNNLFSGQVPASISMNKKLKPDLSGNAALFYQTPGNNSPYFGGNVDTTPYIYSTRRKKKNKLPIILGSTISVFVVLSAAAGIFAIYRHKAKTAEAVAQAAAAGRNGGGNKPRETTEETPITAQSGVTNP